MTVQQYSLVAGDWINLESIINDLARTLGQGLSSLDSPEFVGLTLSGLTVSRLVATDADKVLESVDVIDWITGTDNQINIGDDGDGTATLSLPQDIATDSEVIFGGITTTGTIDAHTGKVRIHDNTTLEPTLDENGEIVLAVVAGVPRIYFRSDGTTYYTSGEFNVIPQTGNPQGLWLFWFTYT
jgi:hypothetical protein